MNFISGTLEFLNNRNTLICDGGQTIDLVDWPDLVGPKLTMGIRPEHMELKTEKSSKVVNTVLDAKVSVLEPMGHEVIGIDHDTNTIKSLSAQVFQSKTLTQTCRLQS